MESGFSPRRGTGIRLQRLNTIMIVLAIFLAMVVTFAAVRTGSSYGHMREDTEAYIASIQNAADMQSGSDYLTEQVRSFVVTGERAYVDRFFEEVFVTQRRDRALESLNAYLADSESYSLLRDALSYSTLLIQREYYAMRLAIEAFGYDVAAFPEELQQVELSTADRALTGEDKAALARQMVFDAEYRQYKERISADVSQCQEMLLGETQREQENSSTRLYRVLNGLELLIGIQLLLVFALVFAISRLIIHPLQDNILRIESQQRLQEGGAYELRFLARTYNRMFELSRKEQEQLSYEATHDALTGLYNRSGFDQLRESHRQEQIALLLIDLDHFKSINDSYGHDAGDRALQKLAAILLKSFRSEDFVCRIGGDEFAVIMAHAGSELRELVQRKIQSANDRLKVTDDGLPSLSISAGVAFWDRENPGEDIYKDADIALYRAKESGRNGCAFY